MKKILNKRCFLLLILFSAILIVAGCANGIFGKPEYETITITYKWSTVKSNILQETLYGNFSEESYKIEKGKGMVIPAPRFANPTDYKFDGSDYRFIKWPRLGETIYKNTILDAQYAELFYVTFNMFDGVSYTDTCINGEMPEYSGDLNFSTELADYTFLNWDKEITAVENKGTSYNAKFDVKIKNGITEIPSYKFDNCDYIRNITIPESVVEIGNSAFHGCNDLYFDIDFSKLTNIGSNAFYDCDTIVSLDFGTELASIGNNAFNNCDNITDIKIPENVTSIGTGVFDSCKNLSDVTVGIITANMTSFSYLCNSTAGTAAEGLNITIGKNIKNIPAKFFTGASLPDIKNIVFESGSSCTAIGDYAFQNTKITSLNIPTSITTIGRNAFSGADNLVCELLLPNITSIGMDAFSECEKITGISLGGNLNTVASAAFSDCTGIKFVNLAEGIENIGLAAFYNTNISTIILPSTVKTIAQNAFGKTKITEVLLPAGLESITTMSFGDFLQSYSISNNSLYKSLDGVIYSPDGKILILYPQAKTTVILPDEVEEIADFVFFRSKLESITFNEGFKKIGKRTFSTCNELKTITLPASCTSIGEEAFEYCQKLASVNVENDSRLTFIGAYAFSACNLSAFTLPKNATIRITTFGVSGITFYFTGTETEWNNKYSTLSGKEDFEYGSIFNKYEDFMTNNTVLYYGTDWEYDIDGVTPIIIPALI